MPAIILQTSVKCTDKQKNQLAADLSKICAAELGKPESYVMAIVQDNSVIYFGGEAKPAAMVNIKSIGGLNPTINTNLTKSICDLLMQTLHIAPNNTYLNFTDIAQHNWGWNGSTFA